MSERDSSGARPPVAVLDGACALTPAEIGGKAWGINRIRALGLPTPPAIVVTTQACREYHLSSAGVLSEVLWARIVQQVAVLEQGTNRRFGGKRRPLLVSVRSGAARSMPGMMDTVLNLGINATIEAAIAVECSDAEYAAETHLRFAEQYRKVVLGDRPGTVPEDPWAQLRATVAAVFDSWQSPRAQAYRHNRGLSDDDFTAVTIQAMVFGNLDDRSGTGVLFSRNPMTGEPPPWGEWLAGGQGEDVVSGRHTPEPLEVLRTRMPAVHADLMRASAMLEADTRDIQDIEFTVESGQLWLLQTRVAKRSAQAALRAAVSFAEEGLIRKEDAVRRLSVEQVRQLPTFRLSSQTQELAPLALGKPACPGVASGVVVTDPEEAETRERRGEEVILARATTSPEDLHGMIAARGLMTEQGGATSHAAVVSRELGRPCVVGCGAHTVTTFAGRRVTMDGASGRVWAGELAFEQIDESSNGDVRKLLEWGAPLIPMLLLRSEEAVADTVDLEALGERWQAMLRPGITVRGRVLETEVGIRAALAAGVRAAVVRHRLPALIACLQPAPPKTEAMPQETQAGEISELTLLRLAALKGRATEEILAEALSLPNAGAAYACLCERGLCVKAGNALRVSAVGRERLAKLLAEERAGIDPSAMLIAYEDFCVFNAELKQIMTAWQLRDGVAVNDHRDEVYDRAVLRRLENLHGRFAAFSARFTRLSPRLGSYAERLERAIARIAAGDHSYVARVMWDSYHTVWFELHEDLIALAGLTRAAVARTDVPEAVAPSRTAS